MQGMSGGVLVSPELSVLSEGDGSGELSPIVADVEGVRLLLHARQLRGRMTLVEASRRAGLNRDELSRLEKGETTQVRFSTIAKLLVAYGCSLADLVEVERVPATAPLYAGALAALEAGVLGGNRPGRRAVRRSSDLDVISKDEEATFAPAVEATSRRRRPAVGTVHQ